MVGEILMWCLTSVEERLWSTIEIVPWGCERKVLTVGGCNMEEESKAG